MSFPYIFHENFESGTKGSFDTETDTGSLLDFPHYSVLAFDPNSMMPYRGAYLLRNALGDTNDHTLTEGDIDIADGGTAYFKWQMGPRTEEQKQALRDRLALARAKKDAAKSGDPVSPQEGESVPFEGA